jgi:hypothetical protein
MPSPGIWVDFTLPSQQSTGTNMILIQPDWTGVYKFTNTYAWFLSYRQGLVLDDDDRILCMVWDWGFHT